MKQDKLQEICTILRRDTLEPAQVEAKKIIDAAEKRANEIVRLAEKEAQAILDNVRKSIEQERSLFQSSLQLAARQGVESLKQEVEKSLFNRELDQFVSAELVKPDVAAQLISAIVKAIEARGLGADISASISKAVSVDDVNRLLGEGIQNKLKERSVKVGNFNGGVQVQLRDKKMTIDMSNEALKELLASYIRKDFRKLFFTS